MKKNLVAYVPVLHEGYRRWLAGWVGRDDLEAVYLLGHDITSQFRPLVKDIRALDPMGMVRALLAVLEFPSAAGPFVVGMDTLRRLNDQQAEVVMPDEEECRYLAATYLPECSVTFDNVFLRWDKRKVEEQRPVQPNRTVTTEVFHQDTMKLAAEAASFSPDWWRQIGAVAVRNGVVLMMAFNHHVPPRTVQVLGDPRAFFTAGVRIDLSPAQHAEAEVVACCAKHGHKLEGADLYVTTFPCPPCARLVAAAGIKRLFFRDGYALLDGEDVLAQAGVEIIQVQ